MLARVLDASHDRDSGVSTETLWVPCRALLELLAVAEPCTLAVGRLDAAHGLPLDVERAHVGGCGIHSCGLLARSVVAPALDAQVRGYPKPLGASGRTRPS